MFKTIVWATDGSEDADRALPYVRELAGAARRASVVVVHSEEVMLAPHVAGAPVSLTEAEIKTKIKEQARALGAGGLEVSTKFLSGTTLVGAARMIASAAREAGADVIVVGTRRHTRLGEVLVGSVTQRLVQLSHCPVLAVPVADG